MAINQHDNSKTFTIFENGSIGPTNQIDRSGFKKGRVFAFWLFEGIGFFLAIIAPHFTVAERLICVGIFSFIGLFFYSTLQEKRWLEIDKVTKTLTIYKDKTKTKIIRSFGLGDYLIRHYKLATNPKMANFNYGICVFPTDDPKGHKFSYNVMIFSSDVKEREAEDYAREVNVQIDNYLNDRPFDKNLIRAK